MKSGRDQDGLAARPPAVGERPWIIYVRVSTADQAREGVSLAAQRAAAAGALALHGRMRHEVVEDAGESAKDQRRPGLQRVLAAVDSGAIAGVIVYKLDRLTRSVVDLYDLIARFDRGGVALVSVLEAIDTSTAMGRFFVGLIALIAQWERETISERVTMGLHHRRAEGGFIGGRVPAGCVVVGEPGKRVLIADPNAHEELLASWQRIIDGATLAQICDHLNARAIAPGGKVKRWNRQNLRKFLTAERVVGVLVNRELRDRAMAALGARWHPRSDRPAAKRVAPAARSERVWRLAAIARCAYCGNTLSGIHSRGRHGKAFPYLRCSAKRKGACSAPDLPAVAWEDAVVTCVRAAVASDGPLLAAITAERAKVSVSAGAAAAQRGELVLERDRVQARIDRLVSLIAEGDAEGRAVAPKVRELQTTAERLDVDIARCDGVLAAARITEQDVDVMMARLRLGLEELPSKPPAEQVDALRVLLLKATLGADRPIELTLRVPGTAEGFVHQSRVVEGCILRTNPATVTVAYPVAVTRRAGKILVQPGLPQP